MAKAVVTIKVMPDKVEADFDQLTEQCLKKVSEFAGEGQTKTEVEPIAFGLKALKIIFVMEEELGSPEKLEKDIQAMDGVMSCETIDVRRAIG